MCLQKEFLFIILLITLAFPAVSRNLETSGLGSDSLRKAGISQDENILFNMINDMRRQGNLPLVPLSFDLCKVAHVHIDDLIASRPQEKGCSLHSWSNSGKWTACCNSKDPAGIQCMKMKPKEITGYQGYGYELIYWGEEDATPADAADLWKQTDASADMILCRGKWKSYQWKAVGVGIRNGYAVLWLGDKADTKSTLESGKALALSEPMKQESEASKSENKASSLSSASQSPNPEKTVINEKDNSVSNTETAVKYYLIVASVKSSEAAKSELKRIKNKGFPEAFILPGDAVYRISVGAYDSSKEAGRALSAKKGDFPGAWIYKK